MISHSVLFCSIILFSLEVINFGPKILQKAVGKLKSFLAFLRRITEALGKSESSGETVLGPVNNFRLEDVYWVDKTFELLPGHRAHIENQLVLVIKDGRPIHDNS